MKTYLTKNVLDAARERIAMLFDNFERICVAVSSGKDSSVLYQLCLQEAVARGRKIAAFFIDQEAEYAASIAVIREMMSNEHIDPRWYQVPLYMTNATSYSEYFLYAWGPGEQWMREKDPLAIHEIDGEYPKRFYEFIRWFERADTSAAYLVGLRADESLTRYRAVTKFPGWNGIKWGSMDGEIKTFYPIYDWTVYDVWKFIYDYNIPYNKIYDLMYLDGYGIYRKMRISNLIHEKSFKCLVDLPRFEPETYDRLCSRIGGISSASRYAAEKLIFDNKTLPKHYQSWREFRDFLLENIPNPEHRARFSRRFSAQPASEKMYQGQAGQLLINDYENSRPVDTKRTERIRRIKEKWMELL